MSLWPVVRSISSQQSSLQQQFSSLMSSLKNVSPLLPPDMSLGSSGSKCSVSGGWRCDPEFRCDELDTEKLLLLLAPLLILTKAIMANMKALVTRVADAAIRPTNACFDWEESPDPVLLSPLSPPGFAWESISLSAGLSVWALSQE